MNFAHYELLADEHGRPRSLGHGAMGRTWLAIDPRLNKKVVIKTMLPALAGDAALRMRFMREAHALARLRDSRVAGVLFRGEDEECPFYVMDYLEGPTLQELIKSRGKLPVEEALRHARDIALALEAVERAGLVHRDIKPANIIVNADDRGGTRACLVDFGLVRFTDGSAGGTVTKTGGIGTPHFAAPELMGEAEEAAGADIRADLYSLACPHAFERPSSACAPRGSLAGQKLLPSFPNGGLPVDSAACLVPEL